MDDPSTQTPRLIGIANYDLSGKITIFVVVTLMAVIIFILCFQFYARLISRHIHRRSAVAATAEETRRRVDLSAAALCHRGLTPALIKLIPTFHYSSSSTSDASAGGPRLECAVCLSEFEDGDTGRVLPGCRHSFHVECIDLWFRSHSSCPLCRAAVKPTARDLESGEVFIPIGLGVVVGPGPVGAAECGCSTATAVLMVPVECRPKSVDLVAEPVVWVVPPITTGSLPV